MTETPIYNITTIIIAFPLNINISEVLREKRYYGSSCLSAYPYLVPNRSTSYAGGMGKVRMGGR